MKANGYAQIYWDTSAVAQELGCTRKTVYARMKRLCVPTRRNATQAEGVNARVWSIGDLPTRSATSQD